MPGNPFIDILKGPVKNFIKKNPKISTIIGIVSVLFIFFLFLPQVKDSWNEVVKFFTPNEKTEKELIIEWLEENFTDSTYNVLIFPFSDYKEDSTKKLKIEKAINDRLDEYRRNELYKNKTKSKIKIKFYEEVEKNISVDSLLSIANKYRTNLMIYGDIYDEPKTVSVNYYILTKSNAWEYFGKEGAIKGIAFKSMYDFREGKILKDLDYLTYWIFCNEMIFYNEKEPVIDIWASIERIYYEEIFRKSNSYLSAQIGYFLKSISDVRNSKEFFLKSIKYNQNSMAFNNLGLIYAESSVKDSSIVCYKKAIELNPNNFIAYNNFASFYIHEKFNIEFAIEYLKKALQLNNNFGYANYNLGLIYSQFFNDNKSALKEYKIALTLLPDSVDILRSIGSVYTEINTDSAKYYLFKALEINQTDFAIYIDLGKLYNKLGNNDKSKEYYFKSLSLNPINHVAYNNLGNLFNDPNIKISYFNKSIKEDINYFLPYYNIGTVYFDDYKNYKQAKYYFQKSIALNKYYADNYVYLGNIYLDHEKRLDSAYINYKKAIQYGIKNAGVYVNCAILSKNIDKNYIYAEIYFLKAISLDPKMAAAYWNYAMLLHFNLNDDEKGKKYYLEAIKLDKKFKRDDIDKIFNLK